MKRNLAECKNMHPVKSEYIKNRDWREMTIEGLHFEGEIQWDGALFGKRVQLGGDNGEERCIARRSGIV